MLYWAKPRTGQVSPIQLPSAELRAKRCIQCCCFQPLNFGTICYKVKVNQNGEKWEKLLLWVDKLDNGALTLAQNFPECIPLLPSLGFLIQGCSLHSQKWQPWDLGCRIYSRHNHVGAVWSPGWKPSSKNLYYFSEIGCVNILLDFPEYTTHETLLFRGRSYGIARGSQWGQASES